MEVVREEGESRLVVHSRCCNSDTRGLYPLYMYVHVYSTLLRSHGLNRHIFLQPVQRSRPGVV